MDKLSKLEGKLDHNQEMIDWLLSCASEIENINIFN